MEKEIRLSFFKRLKMSVFDFDKYHVIASEGLGRAMMYLVKLMLLFALIMSLSLTFKFSQIVNEATGYINNEVPNFYFKDNTFTLENEEDIIIENHEYIDFKIILSNAETYNEEEIRDFDGIVVTLLKNNVLFKDQNSTSIITQTYEEISKVYNINELNKEKLVTFFNGENGYAVFANIFAVIFITIFLTYFMTAILDTIALSLLGFIVSRLIRVPLKYGAIYSIAISAITLPVIINIIYMIVNLYTGFVIPYFQIMYTLVSYVYLIAALLIMRSEILKKKIKIKIGIMNKEILEKENKEKENDKDEKEGKEKKDVDKKEKSEDEQKDNKINKKEKKKDELKDKVEGKMKNNKDNPEPQANIQEK